MATINYLASDFDVTTWGSLLSGDKKLTCTWADVVRAAITLGKHNYAAIFKYNSFSKYEMIFRAAMIYTSLMEDSGTYKIRRTELFKHLDPSEKGAISYFLGLTNAKIFAEKLLDVPWLMHLDVYKPKHKLDHLGNTRPDLFGYNISKNGWVVIEAKGRSRGFSRKAFEKAKAQSQNLVSIASQNPILNVAIQSYFPSDAIKVKIADPEAKKDGIHLDITMEKWIGYNRLDNKNKVM
ncbi:hypothetical protein [Alkaliphilus hydrothermalis]|uniref:Protein NO VEIN C-terminal domain-containing protein n=1 Tax=Alkaliphilus hydrothermalis TaxID=1482730 RepID=A0ABS2NU49_9FIRM|nr:hypothetical protein [Alkaliphilus hydrothermalis]MBM7616392.1 hypothetical protein [Alkaliphilus hydrothermalis]